jgi:hypothetical protein
VLAIAAERANEAVDGIPGAVDPGDLVGEEFGKGANGGALLSLAIIDSADPAWQVGSFLLGGGAALVAHAGKAGARALVNTSPEPFSNVVVSTAEDVAAGGLLALAIANPVAAAIIALGLVALSIWLVFAARRALRKLIDRLNPPRAPTA